MVRQVQPGRPVEGEPDDDSGSVSGQSYIDLQDIPDSPERDASVEVTGTVGIGAVDAAADADGAVHQRIESSIADHQPRSYTDIAERLDNEKPGDFNFNVQDVSLIRGLGDYRLVRECCEATHNNLQRVDDFPIDPAATQQRALELAQALVKFEGAVELEKPGRGDNAAIRRIKNMTKTHILMLAWMLLYAMYAIQAGVRRRSCGDDNAKLVPEHFDSFDARFRAVKAVVERMKSLVVSLITGREAFAYRLAGHPAFESGVKAANRAGNSRKAERLAAAEEAAKKARSTSARKTKLAATSDALDFPSPREGRDGQVPSEPAMEPAMEKPVTPFDGNDSSIHDSGGEEATENSYFDGILAAPTQDTYMDFSLASYLAMDGSSPANAPYSILASGATQSANTGHTSTGRTPLPGSRRKRGRTQDLTSLDPLPFTRSYFGAAPRPDQDSSAPSGSGTVVPHERRLQSRATRDLSSATGPSHTYASTSQNSPWITTNGTRSSHKKQRADSSSPRPQEGGSDLDGARDPKRHKGPKNHAEFLAVNPRPEQDDNAGE